jgi:hypothetical protein
VLSEDGRIVDAAWAEREPPPPTSVYFQPQVFSL